MKLRDVEIPAPGVVREAIFALLLSVATPFGVAAQGQGEDIPRLPDGRPDMNGVWQSLGNHHWDIEPHPPSRAGPVDSIPAAEMVPMGPLASVPWGWGVVEGGEIPYLPDALERRNENRERYLERDPVVKCYLPGVPRANYMPFPFQIFQSGEKFFIAYEYAGAVRDIYLEDPGPPQVDSWMGQSVGHWEGDTFVVNVSGFNGQTWFDRAGNHHSYALEVEERWTMMGPDHIMYEATMEDPNTFSEPWTIRLPLYRHVHPDARLGQFKCVPFVEELMYGDLRKTPVDPEEDE